MRSEHGELSQPSEIWISYQDFFAAVKAGAEGFPPEAALEAALYIIAKFTFDDAGCRLIDPIQ